MVFVPDAFFVAYDKIWQIYLLIEYTVKTHKFDNKLHSLGLLKLIHPDSAKYWYWSIIAELTVSTAAVFNESFKLL